MAPRKAAAPVRKQPAQICSLQLHRGGNVNIDFQIATGDQGPDEFQMSYSADVIENVDEEIRLTMAETMLLRDFLNSTVVVNILEKSKEA